MLRLVRTQILSESQIWEESQNRKEIQRWSKGLGMGCGVRMGDE